MIGFDRILVWAIVGWVSATGCGPSTGAPPPQTCGGDDPVKLVDLPPDTGWRTLAASTEQFVMERWVLEQEDQTATQQAFVLEACGESVVELSAATTAPTEHFGVAGPWPLAVDIEDGSARWLDPTGTAPSHPVFPSTISCVQEVAGGLAALGSDGTVWFHPDPAEPSLDAVPVITGVRRPDWPRIPLGDFTRCELLDADIPVADADGDALLVMLDEGPLVRVTVPTGEQETIIDGPVSQFMSMDDPRYILWRGGSELDPDSDCCTVRARDRETGEDISVGGDLFPVNSGAYWVSSLQWGPTFENQGTVFTHAATGATVRVDGWWTPEAVLSDTQLLVAPVDELGTAIVDLTTGVVGPSPLPAPPLYLEPTYPDGVTGLELVGDAESGRLHFLPFDGSPARVLAENVGDDFVRTQTGTLVYVDRVSPADTYGPLVMVTRAGERTVIHDHASSPWVPFHGEARERNEVLFVRQDPQTGDRSLWRYVLPE
ncbi:MAG: hypothetical protein AAF799_24400 [Myxococcota bacterium]